jgi:hypothetical protein
LLLNLLNLHQSLLCLMLLHIAKQLFRYRQHHQHEFLSLGRRRRRLTLCLL